MPSKNSNTVLAIDFGTSNSLVGAVQDGKRIEALPLDPFAENPTMMRTLLYFANADECHYGAAAIQKFVENEMEGRLFRSFKSHLPNANYLGTVLEGRVLRLETLIGIFLLELKKRSEKILGQQVNEVVLGRPARYSMDDEADSFAVHRMQKAAEFAGFQSVRFVPEPLAAGLEFRRTLKEEKTVLIGDFGGGTSDFTVMRMSPESFRKEDVLGVDGCALAGDALDSVFMSERLNRTFGAHSKYRLPMSSNLLSMPISLMDRLNKPSFIVHLREKENYNFLQEVKKCALTEKDKAAVERLFTLIDDQQAFPFFEEIERTKRQLSSHKSAEFHFRYPKLETTDTFFASEFAAWSDKIRMTIMESVDRCLVQAKTKDDQIDLVFLTGGTAHVPFIRQEFEKRFGVDKLQGGSAFHSVLSGLVEAAKISYSVHG